MLRSWDSSGPFLEREYEQPSRAPLETPSHNGPWRGTVPVTTLAPGVMGCDLPVGPKRQAVLRSLERGRMNRWREQLRRKIERETGAQKRRRQWTNGNGEHADPRPTLRPTP